MVSKQYENWLFDKAVGLMKENLPRDFLTYIPNDLYEALRSAFEGYIESKGLFPEEMAAFEAAEAESDAIERRFKDEQEYDEWIGE